VTHSNFYWLAAPHPEQGVEMSAERSGQTITLQAPEGSPAVLRLNDRMLDLDEPVIVLRNGAPAFKARVSRTIATLAATLAERGDPELMFSAQILLDGKTVP
jgi:hypothetical protein